MLPGAVVMKWLMTARLCMRSASSTEVMRTVCAMLQLVEVKVNAPLVVMPPCVCRATPGVTSIGVRRTSGDTMTSAVGATLSRRVYSPAPPSSRVTAVAEKITPGRTTTLSLSVVNWKLRKSPLLWRVSPTPGNEGLLKVMLSPLAPNTSLLARCPRAMLAVPVAPLSDRQVTRAANGAASAR